MSEEKKDLEKDVVLASSETSEESALDFSELDSLKETNFERDPWYQTAGLAIARFLAKAGLWILGILYDCIKYLLLVVKYILGAVLMIIPGIYIVGRKAVMMFNDMDWAGKLSFIVMGASQLKRKQWLDGVVFLVVEIAFLFYMFVPISGGVGAGVSAINAFIHLGENSTDTRPELIFGFYAWIILIGFMVVYVLSLKGAYDSYMITAADKYKRARMEGIHVLNHPEIYHGKQKSDGTYVDFARMTHLSINRTLKQEYGFDALTARVVSRIAWSKCADPIALGYDNEGNFAIGNVFKSDADAWSKTQAFLVILWEKVLWLFRLIKTFYYNKIYNPCRNFVMARLYWFKPIERYCYWYLENKAQDPIVFNNAVEGKRWDEVTVEDKKKVFMESDSLGKCAFDGPQDLVDHQTTAVDFSNGVTATLTMVGGASYPCRTIHIILTKGELYGMFESNKLHVMKYDMTKFSRTTKTLYLGNVGIGHGGGDMRLIADFIEYLRTGKKSISQTRIENSIDGHLLGIGADLSDKTRKTVKITDDRNLEVLK